MQIFKAFCTIGRRRLLTIGVYFAVYAIIICCLSMTSEESMNANFQARELSICVIDEDKSQASEALKKYLDSMHTIVALKADPEVLQEHLYYRDIQYVLTIPAGFERRLIDGAEENLVTNVKVPGSSAGYFADQQVGQYLRVVQLYLSGGFSLEESLQKADASFGQEQNVKNVSFEHNDGVGRKELFYFYQYIPYVLILLLFCGLAPIIILFRQKDISNRINCSALSLWQHDLQLLLGCGAYSLAIWALFMVFGVILFGREMFLTNALYAMLNSLVFLLISVGFAMFLSCFSMGGNTGNVVNIVANIVGLGISFLGGVFVPQYMLSDSVLAVGKFLPTYWYIRANNMLGGLSTETFDKRIYWTAIGIQLLFAVAAFALTLVASKVKRTDAI